jgi:hypothetical protein
VCGVSGRGPVIGTEYLCVVSVVGDRLSGLSICVWCQW